MIYNIHNDSDYDLDYDLNNINKQYSNKIYVYVINLNRRIDRKLKIIELYDELFNLFFVDAIEDDDDGAIGCFKSHQKCIEIAKKNNLEKILVMEDDCNIDNLTSNEFKKIISQLDEYLSKKNDWTIFYGAGNKIRYDNIVKKYTDFIFIDEKNNKFELYEVNFSKTAHFVWYNSKIYDWILGLNPILDNPIDKIWHGKFNCIIILPFITSQFTDYSDIEKKQCIHKKSLKRYERRILDYLKNNNS
jgi:GR25 family glycosyltransferase involved in LPS biosynthesis